MITNLVGTRGVTLTETLTATSGGGNGDGIAPCREIITYSAAASLTFGDGGFLDVGPTPYFRYRDQTPRSPRPKFKKSSKRR